MPILSASLLPHSPLLIPEIGKNNHSVLSKTSAAYQEVGADLQKKEIDNIIILSPQKLNQSESFIFNIAPEFSLSLENFGYINNKKIAGNVALPHELKSALKNEFFLQKTTITNLDYSSAVPLYLLKEQLPDLKAFVIHACPADLQDHYNFGLSLGKALDAREEKIALVASGDLSCRLKKNSPGGYSPKGAKLDNKIIAQLSEGDKGIDTLLTIDKKTRQDAGESGLATIAMLLGALTGKDYQAEVLSYQTDFGIGYLSMDFILK